MTSSKSADMSLFGRKLTPETKDEKQNQYESNELIKIIKNSGAPIENTAFWHTRRSPIKNLRERRKNSVRTGRAVQMARDMHNILLPKIQEQGQILIDQASIIESLSSAQQEIDKLVADLIKQQQEAPAAARNEADETYAEHLYSDKGQQESLKSSPSTGKKDKMTDISREELDAKLERTEARMDARVADVVGRIDTLIVAQQGRDRLTEHKFEQLREAQKETLTGIKSLKTTVIVTMIGGALTVIFGVAAFNATLVSNMVSSFESGKNTMQSLNQVSNQLNDAAKRMNEIEQRLEQQRAATAAAASAAAAAATAASSSADKPDSQKK